MRFEEFVALPVVRRRLVIFAEDELVEYMERHHLDKATPNWLEAYRVGRRGIDPSGVFKAVWRTSDGIKIRAIPESWAANFGLPVGHPKSNALYAAHPVTPHRYIPMAEFHRSVFEQKVGELVLILTSLGAVSLQVECIEGWGESMAGSLSIGLPSARIGVKGDGQQAVHRRILFKAQFREREIQELPRDLVWLPHEPLWQQVVHMRRSGALEDFAVCVDYRNDFGINVELVGSLKKMGIDVGGQFVRQESTVWTMAGKFG